MLLAAERSMGPYITWIAVMMGAVTISAVVILLLRARVLGKGAAQQDAGLMDDLREMRDSGELSVEEFDAAKKALRDRLAASTSGPPPKPTKRPRPAPRGTVAPPGYDLTGSPLPKPPDEAGDR